MNNTKKKKKKKKKNIAVAKYLPKVEMFTIFTLGWNITEKYVNQTKTLWSNKDEDLWHTRQILTARTKDIH